ncbi:MAG: hypothetical protein HYR56_28740 [Acidobacteria bacterium]|nr:hypothetical protein [Acidobacteriota bacterium]MBI3424026.1 hypothetical protein [Acidobacteriota bacterium]
MAVKTAKAGKAAKAIRQNGRPPGKRKRAKTKDESELEARLLAALSDPQTTPMMKALAPFLLARLESGEPYLTIEQIQEQLGRRA